MCAASILWRWKLFVRLHRLRQGGVATAEFSLRHDHNPGGDNNLAESLPSWTPLQSDYNDDSTALVLLPHRRGPMRWVSLEGGRGGRRPDVGTAWLGLLPGMSVSLSIAASAGPVRYHAYGMWDNNDGSAVVRPLRRRLRVGLDRRLAAVGQSQGFVQPHLDLSLP